MAELTKIVAQIKGAKMVSSALLNKILVFYDIKHQTWFVGGNCPGVYCETSPGPPLKFFPDKSDGNYPSGLSGIVSIKGYLNILNVSQSNSYIFKYPLIETIPDKPDG